MNALRLLAANHHHQCRRSVIVSAGKTTTTKMTMMTKPVATRSFASLKDSYDNILVEHPTENVAVIKLHRPKALNALSDALFEDLFHATTVLNDNSKDNPYNDIRCLILTGSGSKAFAAGADISEMQSRGFEQVYGQEMFRDWQQLSKLHRLPIIAAVSGYCLGGGCEVAMMCDMILCDETAKFGQPEINLGVLPGAGGTQRLTRAIGKSKSMYMNLMGGDYMMTATEAYQSGLVATMPLKDNDELMEESIRVATVIANKGRLAVQAVKEAVNAADELSLQEGLRLERRLFHGLFATDDQKEGMAAFLEKRKPEFK